MNHNETWRRMRLGFICTLAVSFLALSLGATVEECFDPDGNWQALDVNAALDAGGELKLDEGVPSYSCMFPYYCCGSKSHRQNVLSLIRD